MEKAGGSVKVLAPAKEADAEPKGKNKRKALEAAKGGDKPKGGKPKEPEGAQGGCEGRCGSRGAEGRIMAAIRRVQVRQGLPI